MRNVIVAAFALMFVVGFLSTEAHAQTDLRIRGAQAGFPIAVAQLCDQGGSSKEASGIPEVLGGDLQVSGLFKVIDPKSHIESPGKCGDLESVAFSDWSVIGAEGLVKGEVSRDGDDMVVTMILYDVLQQRSVLGKRYEAPSNQYSRIAHKFANEIVGFFTGEPGIFGSRIAYIGKVGRFKELFIMDVDGSNRQQLTADKGLVVSPSWSPRGDRLVFTSYKSRTPELYTINPDGGGVTQVTERSGLELSPRFTPDARSIVASASVAGVTNLVMFDLRGRLIRKLTNSSSIDVTPSFSPLGDKMVFCSSRGGGPQIYLMSLDSADARRVSFTNSNYCTSPAWSPKGDKIAFVCRASGNQIFISTPEGKDPVQITFSGNNEDPNWSPDGRYIIFSSDFGRGGDRQLAMITLATGEIKPLPGTTGGGTQPAWSPRID